MGYPAMTSQERAGKRRRKGAGKPCRENGRTLIPQLPENNVVKVTTLFFRNASERRGISMYMTNEEWEQNNQDYLKESYEETGFPTGGYAIRKLICGGCGRCSTPPSTPRNTVIATGAAIRPTIGGSESTAKYTVRIWFVSAAARNSRPNVQVPAIAATPVGKKTIENVLQISCLVLSSKDVR